MYKSVQKAIEAYAKEKRAELSEETRRMIRLANWDLWNGPHPSFDDEGLPYPGFEKACRLIRDELDLSDIWIDEGGFVSNSEPEFSEEDGVQWYRIDAGDIGRAVVGNELWSYVR